MNIPYTRLLRKEILPKEELAKIPATRQQAFAI
jgi:hypothetical protein